jgi:hypothetical protein
MCKFIGALAAALPSFTPELRSFSTVSQPPCVRRRRTAKKFPDGRN